MKKLIKPQKRAKKTAILKNPLAKKKEMCYNTYANF
jgi:hypothetical protein